MYEYHCNGEHGGHGIEKYYIIPDFYQWVSLREKLEETPLFHGNIYGFLQILPMFLGFNTTIFGSVCMLNFDPHPARLQQPEDAKWNVESVSYGVFHHVESNFLDGHIPTESHTRN